MAYQRDITADDKVYFDTDRLLRYSVYDGDPTAEEIAAGTATPLDVTGWDLAWVLRKKTNSADPPLIEKTVGAGITITGTFNSDPDINTQRIEVLLADSDTYDPAASPPVEIKAGSYVYALKRIDAGSETILAEGKFTLLRAAAWE
jgi:hypothetical protein